MAIERDNNDERDTRIDEMLRKIRVVQKRVEQLATDGQARAEQISRDRKGSGKATD